MNSRSKKFTKDVTPSKPPSRRCDANDALAMVLKGKWGRIYDYPWSMSMFVNAYFKAVFNLLLVMEL